MLYLSINILFIVILININLYAKIVLSNIKYVKVVNKFMVSKNYFLNGVTELLILSILNKSDTYIYNIKKIISKISDDNFSMSQNTIYAAAYKLENEGKITEYSKLVGRKRTRIYYHIEAAGIEYLEMLTSYYKTVTSNVENILSFLENCNEGDFNE